MTSLNLQRTVNTTMTPIREDITIPPYPVMPAPLKMHTVHVEDRPNPAPVDVTLPPSHQRCPFPGNHMICEPVYVPGGQSDSTIGLKENSITNTPEDNPTPVHSIESETKPLRRASALDVLDQLESTERQNEQQQQQQQAAPPVPARNPRRNSVKQSWLSKLLGKLTCTHQEDLNRTTKPAKPVKVAKSFFSKRSGRSSIGKSSNICTGGTTGCIAATTAATADAAACSAKGSRTY